MILLKEILFVEFFSISDSIRQWDCLLCKYKEGDKDYERTGYQRLFRIINESEK